MNMTSTPEQGEAFARMFAERQISQIGVLGSNVTTGPLIEESWERYLDVFDRHLQNNRFSWAIVPVPAIMAALAR